MAKDDVERYHAAAHAVQSGVMVSLERGSDEGSPKHLRTGVNVALCQQAAVVLLLIKHGVITEDEYMKQLAIEMEKEKLRYEEKLGVKLG